MDDEGIMPETDDLAVRTFTCVWDALADSPAEAIAIRLRSDLLSAIQQTVASWGMTRAAVARRLELTLATRAGLDVRMQIEPAVTG